MTQRQVILDGGVPWGFRMHGGVDLNTPLKVSRINPGSKATQRGIREGDIITSINDQSTRNLTNNEAHNLLKQAGTTLKLGLNEDIEFSPKKKHQYRTIHHETHQETVQRSSITYTLKETVQRSSTTQQGNNEFENPRQSEFINVKDTKQNGDDIRVVTNIPISQKSTPSSSTTSTPSTLVPEDRNISTDNAIVSRQSSYSNCSSIPDEGLGQRKRQAMNDGERMSKSKRRRQRRKNQLSRSVSSQTTTNRNEVEIQEIEQKNQPIVLEPAATNLEVLRLKRIEHKYKVESPKELSLENLNRSKKKLKTKSKSLDDDDLKIQELSEASESEEAKCQSNVVISEASSEENLLDDSDSDTQKKRSDLTSISLKLNDDNEIEATSHISPAEEQELRSFLGGLKLVNSPEESAKDLYERTTGLNDPKAKKLQKRKELEEYFMPIAQNPRYLDAISEETSDISDKECSASIKSVHHVKQVTPEFNVLNHYSRSNEIASEKPILVEAKVVEPLKERICDTKIGTVHQETAEVVYLDDSSESSRSSGEFNEKVIDNEEDNDNGEMCKKNKDKDNMGLKNLTGKDKIFLLENNDRNIEFKKTDNFEALSEETESTTVSCHTSTTKKILPSPSDNLHCMQTPPSTPSNLGKNDKSNLVSKFSFDYTKTPNVLKEKEPEEKLEKHPDRDAISKNKETIGDPKIKKFGNNTSQNGEIQRTEMKSSTSTHSKRKLVNGIMNSDEFQKNEVKEISKNNGVISRDFKEHIKETNSKDSIKTPVVLNEKEFDDRLKKQPVEDTNRKTVNDQSIQTLVNEEKIKTQNGEVNRIEIKSTTHDEPKENKVKERLRNEDQTASNDFKEFNNKTDSTDNIKTKDILQEKNQNNELKGQPVKGTTKHDNINNNQVDDFNKLERQNGENSKSVEEGSTATHIKINMTNESLKSQEFQNISVKNISKNENKDNIKTTGKDTNNKLGEQLVKDTISDNNKNDNIVDYQKVKNFVKDDKFESRHVDKQRKETKSVTVTHSKKLVNESTASNAFQTIKGEEMSRNKYNEIIEDFYKTDVTNNNLSENKRTVSDVRLTDSVAVENSVNTKTQINKNNSTQWQNKLASKKDLSQVSVEKDSSNIFRDFSCTNKNLSKSTPFLNSHENTPKNCQQIDVTKQSVNCFIKETKKENVLKQVIMSSQDSNKTDSQKLLEYESIKKLNDEIKDRISRQELLGSALRKSKSPASDKIASREGSCDTVIMRSETDLPGRMFVSKRIREFSDQNFDYSENVSTKFEGSFFENKEDNLIQTRPRDCNVPDLSKTGLINVDLPSKNDNRTEIVIPVNLEDRTENKDEGSVLRRLLGCQNTANDNCVKERDVDIEMDLTKSINNSDKKEVLIPVKLITSDEIEKSKEIKEILIPIKLESTKENEEINKEKVIPIIIENFDVIKVKNDNKNINLEKNEHIIPIQLEKVGNNDTDNSVSVKENAIKLEKVKIIPVEIETNIRKPEEKKVPIINKNDSKGGFTEQIRNVSKSLKNIVEQKDHNKVNDSLDEAPTRVPPVPPPRRSKTKLNKNTLQADFRNGIDKNEIPVSKDMTYINVVSPLCPASGSSDSSESDDGSKCTAKYNPNCSIADVASISKNEENVYNINYNPLPLRDIVLKVLVSLPFGNEILKELADVSKTLNYFACSLPFKGLNANNINILAKEEEKEEKNMSSHWSSRTNETERFYATECLVDDCSMAMSPRNSRSPNRFLTIIREEPSEFEGSGQEDTSRERLKARNLGEWLTLARHKSKSTSNLDCITVPINNLRQSIANAQNLDEIYSNTRRRSLPQEIYNQQLIDIMEKERDIQRELERLEEEKRKLRAEFAPSKQREFQMDDFFVSKKGDFAVFRREQNDKKERPVSMPAFPTEFFRQQMYDEYMDKFTEREERKQHKVIKISSSNDLEQEKDSAKVKPKEVIHPIEIEQEFMDKVKEKLKKYDFNVAGKDMVKKDDVATPTDEAPVIVLDGDQVKGVETLPRHLQEFVGDLTTLDNCIWSPGQPRRPPSPPAKQYQRTDSQTSQSQNEPISPIWTPKSANSSPTVERKEFRNVNFQSPVLSRKTRTRSESIPTPDSAISEPPWKLPEGISDTALNLSSTLDRRLPTSQSTPGFGSFSTSPRLPKAQNPTITLLQKAREGQLPRGAQYIEQDRKLPNDRPPIKYPGEVLYHIKNEYTSESDNERTRKMADLTSRKFEGVGPTTKDGMPLILRSEVKDKDQSRWYKRMYDTIHKQKPHKDEYITVKYKQKRAHYPYSSGYLSEPEPGAYDSDFTEYKYQTLDRRRMPPTQHHMTSNGSSTMPRSVPENRSYSSSDIVKNTQEKYYNRPGKIEHYRPGHSSISEKEAKRWWDEVMDIFDGHLEQQSRVPPQKPRSFMNQALKESGYESDSTLVFRRKEETAASQISPKEQKEAYKIIQKGGDVPFQGLRKPAPERPKEPELPPPPPPPKSQGEVRSQEQGSPRKYVENEVTIHYKTPVRTEIKEYVSEDELAHRQAEAMKKIYEEERKRKYLQVSDTQQELQDMKSRRHTDNFIPSQKSPIPLNRYDDFDDLAVPAKTRTRSPESRLVAKALYNFVGQTARELTFRKGELIYVRRQVDKNWYEGELNAMVGLFPVNYVEIVPYEGITKTTPRKAHEGQARAKYNFVAQTHLELSLAKGELVTITRKVDDNWFEGKIGGRKGIFPVSYVEVLIDPSDPTPPSTKPVASPAAHSLLLNGSAQGKESMGSHLYTPNLPKPLAVRDNGFHHAKPIQLSGAGTYSTLPKASRSPVEQALHIETQSEPVPYRALYKYTPQNDDELELLEGDTVFVLEKCDDGWYVGSSERTGAFGTFPGNYVEKI